MNDQTALLEPASGPLEDVRPGGTMIRPTHHDELEAICRLYEPAHDLATVRWLLASPSPEAGPRSLVAVDGDEVIGHVGYTLTTFRWQDREVSAVFCVDWIVDGRYRGRRLGHRLFEATFPAADVGFEYGGTPPSKKLFVEMRFEPLFALTHFVKVLRPGAYARTLSGPPLRRLAKSVVFAGRSLARVPRSSAVSPPVELKPYDPAVTARPGWPVDCVVNAERPALISWYLRCPAVRSVALRVERGGEPLGMALCLVNEHPGGIRTGRIAHLSYMGPDARLWRAVLHALEGWMSDAGCAMVSAFGCHPRFVAALGERGFFPTHEVPVWLRDPEGRLPRAPWHLTGLEGDIGYRRI